MIKFLDDEQRSSGGGCQQKQTRKNNRRKRITLIKRGDKSTDVEVDRDDIRASSTNTRIP